MRKRNTGSDKILTVCFMVSILLGFYLIGMVNAGFESDIENTVLYESDSSAEFVDITLTDLPFSAWENLNTGYFLNYDSEFLNYTKSPVYFGNNSWTIPINGSTHSEAQFCSYAIELPNMENWIISDITINQTINTDTDIRAIWSIYSSQTINKQTYAHSGINVVNDVNAGDSVDYYNTTVNLNLADSLEIYDKAQDGITHYLYVQYIDESTDGLGNFAWDISIEIEGKNINTYNIIQQLNMALSIAIILNVVVIVFMTDSVDIGGFVNDIPDKKKRG